MPKSMFEKIWNAHVVKPEGTRCVLYIDQHYIHEVTSPQAFEGLRLGHHSLRCPQQTLAVLDHSIPTENQTGPIADPIAAKQVETLRSNTKEFGIQLFDMGDVRNGIVHMVGPEQGLTQPGMTIVCGDSHTSTHGAFGSLAFGIGTSDVEHVFATQTVLLAYPRSMRVRLEGELKPGVYAKDVILGLIGCIGVDGGVGHVIEYSGSAVKSMSMEARMTICNMSIEAGARAGMMAPDATTYAYLKGRPYAPKGQDWKRAVSHWDSLSSEEGAYFDKEVHLNVSGLSPQVTWGTNPGMVTSIEDSIPQLKDATDESQRKLWQRALAYMGLKPGMRMQDIKIDRVFIGSCTNSRIEDLREVGRLVAGKRVADNVRAMVVPGSGQVRTQAEAEGLNRIFTEAGLEWREPGCSMCLGMNPDILKPGERCASTSNRNFEGRQGMGGRTHLLSPAMAAAAALTGRLTDVRQLQ